MTNVVFLGSSCSACLRMKTKINCNYIPRSPSIYLNEDMETLIKEYVVSVCQPALFTL